MMMIKRGLMRSRARWRFCGVFVLSDCSLCRRSLHLFFPIVAYEIQYLIVVYSRVLYYCVFICLKLFLNLIERTDGVCGRESDRTNVPAWF